MTGHLEPWCAWKGKLVVGIHNIGDATITSHGLQYIPPIGQELKLESTGPAMAVLPLILGGSVTSAPPPQPLSLLHPTALMHSTVTVTTITASTPHFATLITELNGKDSARAVCGRLRSLGSVLTEVLLLPQCPESEKWGLTLPRFASCPSSLKEQTNSCSSHTSSGSLFAIFVSSASSKRMLKNFALLAQQHAELPIERQIPTSTYAQCVKGVFPAADQRPLMVKPSSTALEQNAVSGRSEQSYSPRQNEQHSKPTPTTSGSSSESSSSRAGGHSKPCHHDLNKQQPRKTCSKCHGYKVKGSRSSDSPQPLQKGSGKEINLTNESRRRKRRSQESVPQSRTDHVGSSPKDRPSSEHETASAQHTSVIGGKMSKPEKQLQSDTRSSKIHDNISNKSMCADGERSSQPVKIGNHSKEQTGKVKLIPDSDIPIHNTRKDTVKVKSINSEIVSHVKVVENLHKDEYRKHKHRSPESKVTKSLYIHSKVRDVKCISGKSKEKVQVSGELAGRECGRDKLKEKLKKHLTDKNMHIKTQTEFEKSLHSKAKLGPDSKSTGTEVSKCFNRVKNNNAIQFNASITANSTKSVISCDEEAHCKNLKSGNISLKITGRSETQGHKDDSKRKSVYMQNSNEGSYDHSRTTVRSTGSLEQERVNLLHANDGCDKRSFNYGGCTGNTKDICKDVLEIEIDEDSKLDFLPNIEFDEGKEISNVKESSFKSHKHVQGVTDCKKIDSDKIIACSPRSNPVPDSFSFDKAYKTAIVECTDPKPVNYLEDKKSEKGISINNSLTVDPVDCSSLHHKSKRHSSSKPKSYCSSHHHEGKQSELKDNLKCQHQKSLVDDTDSRGKYNTQKQEINLVKGPSPVEDELPKKEENVSSRIEEHQNTSDATKIDAVEHLTTKSASKKMNCETVKQKNEYGKDKMIRFKNRPSWSIGRKRKPHISPSVKQSLNTGTIPDNGDSSGPKSTRLLSSMKISKMFKMGKDSKISSIKPSIIRNEDLQMNTNELIRDLETNAELRAIIASFDSRLDLKTEKSLVDELQKMNVPDDKVEKLKEKIMHLIYLLSPELELNRVKGMDKDKRVEKDQMKVPNKTKNEEAIVNNMESSLNKLMMHISKNNEKVFLPTDSLCSNQPLEIEDLDIQKPDKVKGWKKGMNKIKGLVGKITGKRKDDADFSTTSENTSTKRAKLDHTNSTTVSSKVVSDAFEQTSSSVFGFSAGQETTDSARFGDVDSPVPPRHPSKKDGPTGHIIPRTLTSHNVGSDAENCSQTYTETLCVRSVNKKSVREPLIHTTQVEPLDLSLKGDKDDSSLPSSLLQSSDNISPSLDHWENTNVVERNLPSSRVEKHYLLDKFLDAMKDEASVDLNNSDRVSDAGRVSLLRNLSSRSNNEQSNVSALSKSTTSHTADADGTNRLLSVSDLDLSNFEPSDCRFAVQAYEFPRCESRSVGKDVGRRQISEEPASINKPASGSLAATACSDKLDRFMFPQPFGSSPGHQLSTECTPDHLRRVSVNMSCGALSSDNAALSACNFSRDTLEKERHSVSAVLEYMKEMDRNIMAQHLALQRKDETIQRRIKYLSSLMKQQEVDFEDVNPNTASIDSYILRQLHKLHGIENPPPLPFFDNGGQANPRNPLTAHYSQMNPFAGLSSFNQISGMDPPTNFSLPTSLARPIDPLCTQPKTEPHIGAPASTSPFQFALNNSNNLPVLSCKPPIHPNTSLPNNEVLQGVSQEMAQWKWQSLENLSHLVENLDTPVDPNHFASNKYASIYIPTADERAHFKRLLVSQRLFYAPLLSLGEGGGHLLVRSSALPGLMATDVTLASLLARDGVSVYTFSSGPELAEGRVTARLRLGALLLLDHSALMDPQLGVLLHNLAMENDRLRAAFNVVFVTKSVLRKCYILCHRRRPPSALETKMVTVLRTNLDLLLGLSHRGLVHAVTGLGGGPFYLPALHRAMRFMHRAALLLTGASVAGAKELSGEDTAPLPSSSSFYRSLSLASLLPAAPHTAWSKVDQSGGLPRELTGTDDEEQIEEMIPTIVITSPTKRELQDREAVQSPSITSCRGQSSSYKSHSTLQSAKRKQCDDSYPEISLEFPVSGTSFPGSDDVPAAAAVQTQSPFSVPAQETINLDAAMPSCDVSIKNEPQTKQVKMEYHEPAGPVNIFDETVLFDMEEFSSSQGSSNDVSGRLWLSSTEGTSFYGPGMESDPPPSMDS